MLKELTQHETVTVKKTSFFYKFRSCGFFPVLPERVSTYRLSWISIDRTARPVENPQCSDGSFELMLPLLIHEVLKILLKNSLAQVWKPCKVSEGLKVLHCIVPCQFVSVFEPAGVPPMDTTAD